ncbi:hypothetical protein [Paractinoplanes durhamensis]|uniref:Uncharacterized protein n=1 Tax=Paractinoplanes durhamensis TaxID=113563 RepID=A0ABQ3Z961_9ACTN|nr:hypothetical protein [Actinoplanes durhamensis]GIE06367.1 hypothetical protein Adu01nite_77170 [Actinoplanes durhamensis]
MGPTTTVAYYSADGVRVFLGQFADPAYLTAGFVGTIERLANIGLFRPLGAVAALLWRRTVVAATRPTSCTTPSAACSAWPWR